MHLPDSVHYRLDCNILRLEITSNLKRKKNLNQYLLILVGPMMTLEAGESIFRNINLFFLIQWNAIMTYTHANGLGEQGD